MVIHHFLLLRCWSPGIVAWVQSQGSVLHVASTATHAAHALGTQLAWSSRATHLLRSKTPPVKVKSIPSGKIIGKWWKMGLELENYDLEASCLIHHPELAVLKAKDSISHSSHFILSTTIDLSFLGWHNHPVSWSSWHLKLKPIIWMNPIRDVTHVQVTEQFDWITRKKSTNLHGFWLTGT